jgi:hypothetical protein
VSGDIPGKANPILIHQPRDNREDSQRNKETTQDLLPQHDRIQLNFPSDFEKPIPTQDASVNAPAPDDRIRSWPHFRENTISGTGIPPGSILKDRGAEALSRLVMAASRHRVAYCWQTS